MPYWKRRPPQQQDCEQGHIMEWYKFIGEVLADIRSQHTSPACNVRINSAQCSQLAHAFSAKLAKFWPESLLSADDLEWRSRNHSLGNSRNHSPGDSSGSSRRASSSRKSGVFETNSEISSDTDQDEGFAVLVDCKHALKEVYRVIKELEGFLQACTGQDWWKTALLRADNGEALAVHVHDLVWSVAALDVAVHFAGGCTLESVDAICARRVAECYAEVGRSHHLQNESMDMRRLVVMLKSLEEQYASFSRRKKRTLRVGEENKHRMAAFLLRKLQRRFDTNVPPSQQLPEGLFIHPDDIDFSKRRLLGRGSFGAVYEAYWLGMKFAVKELPCTDAESFKEEASILAKLRSPFTVQLIGWSLDQEANVCHLVMELCDNNLRNHIDRRYKVILSEDEPPFTLLVAVDIMLQIARGMEYLHSQRVTHRDLRASNVLVNGSTVRELLDEGYVRVKLCDFGMAKAKLNSSRLFSSMKGATYWRAPEVFSDPGSQESEEAIKKHYTDKADVYSFAMTCYEILTGKIPFRGVLYKEMYQHVMSGKRPDLPAYCPSLLTDYIKRCWHGDDKFRPSFQDICKVLRHVKLVLMRVDDPEDASFLSVTTEFDYMELSNHSQAVSVSKCGEWSLKESTNVARQQSGNDEAEFDRHNLYSSRTRANRTSIQRMRSLISMRSKSIEPEPKEIVMFTSIAPYIVKYSHHDLRTATANFSETISDSGCIFRGVLSDDTVVAVKVVQVHSADDIRLFCNIALALSNAYHVNLARFRGFCVEESQFFFVYDYLINLSLDKWLIGAVYESPHSKEIDYQQQDGLLDWRTRLKIALGVAHGLAFLHEDCGHYIMPVSPRSSKVLLCEHFEAKINPLNLFKDGRKCQIASHKISYRRSSSSMHVISPEVLNAQSSDVYSFGITLLELIVGRTVDLPKTASEEGLVSVLDKPAEFLRLLVGELQPLNLSECEYEKCISGLWDRSHANCNGGESQAVQKLRTLFQTAMWCVQDSKQRPTISQVIQTLEGTLSVPPQVLASLLSYRDLGII